jgi:lincosamide nucleotidyltransferase A/C/D/E
MREDDVVEILTAMLDADVQSWVDGGWGVDALVGHETRPHKDLDLMVLASQASVAAAALGTRLQPRFRSSAPGPLL